MKNVNLQIECMKKLGIPETYIQETIKKHGNDKSILLTKLIECEEKYSDVGKPDKDEIRFNNYKGSLNKNCEYFDRNKLDCRLGKESCNCEHFIDFD